MGHCMFLRKGETHTAPLSGILASDIAVGSTVKLMENGVAVDYLVVNQGIPGGSSLYDTSCDGMWLLRKDCLDNQRYQASGTANNSYASSLIPSYLNYTFFSTLDSVAQSVINYVRIPICAGGGSTTVSNSIQRVFLLSYAELGFNYNSNYLSYTDGALLSYFLSGESSTQNSKRTSVYSNGGGAATYWTRSPLSNAFDTVFCVGTTGEGSTAGTQTEDRYGGTNAIRPAMILPSTALFDKNTLILKGVA